MVSFGSIQSTSSSTPYFHAPCTIFYGVDTLYDISDLPATIEVSRGGHLVDT